MAAQVGQYDLVGEKLLLQQIAMGDERAFRFIFDTYKARTFTFVVNFIHSKADAEEIIQDTFLNLWQNRISLTAVEHPRNYIYTIVRNKTLRYLSNVARDEKMMKVVWANMQIEFNPTEETLQLRESREQINKALSMLSEQKQKIFKMSREQGMNHENIALETGLSKSRVKNIIVEVIHFIKTFLSRNSLIIMFMNTFLYFLKK